MLRTSTAMAITMSTAAAATTTATTTYHGSTTTATTTTTATATSATTTTTTTARRRVAAVVANRDHGSRFHVVRVLERPLLLLPCAMEGNHRRGDLARRWRGAA